MLTYAALTLLVLGAQYLVLASASDSNSYLSHPLISSLLFRGGSLDTTDNPNGSLDDAAPIHRGKPLGADWDAADLYEAYREIQNDYHKKLSISNLGNNSDRLDRHWRVLAQKEGVEVSMLEHRSDKNCPYVRMTATIPVSVRECWNFLELKNWEESMPTMDPFYEGVTTYGEFTHEGVHMILARKRTKRLLAFGKRDFCFVSVSDLPLEDGTWVSGTVSVQSPTIPREKGYTRAFQDSIAFYKPLNNDGSPSNDAETSVMTNVTIVCRIDLNDSTDDGSGGYMPMWLYKKTIGKTGAKSVHDMRKALIAQKEKLLGGVSKEMDAGMEDLAQVPKLNRSSRLTSSSSAQKPRRISGWGFR